MSEAIIPTADRTPRVFCSHLLETRPALVRSLQWPVPIVPMPHCARQQNNGGRAPFDSMYAEFTQPFLLAFFARWNARPALCAPDCWPCRVTALVCLVTAGPSGWAMKRS